MSVSFKILSEGEVATEASWIERFDGDPNIFTKLLTDGILKYTGLKQGKRKFSLNFVGLLSINQSAWFSFPKASKAQRWPEAKAILRVIIEYRRKITRTPSTAHFSTSSEHFHEGTLVDSFIGLVLLTLSRGFHYHAVNGNRSIHDGIDWARTINSTPAMHSNASVVYPAPLTRIQSHKLSDLAEIQAFCLLDMRNQLGPFTSILTPGVEDLWDECADILTHGRAALNPDSIASIIEDHATSTNRDEDMDLIALLRTWFEGKWSAGQQLSAFGISAFHTVWEDMCAQAISSFGEGIDHAEMASQPTYMLHGQKIILTPQRPDILLKHEGSALLADAKWYILDETSLPQTPDAIKQFAYELSIGSNIHVSANLLLLPSEMTEKWSVAGSLQMTYAGVIDTRFQPISIIALNWLYLAQLYIQRRCLPQQFLADIIASRKPSIVRTI